jgi:hypothetical protein
MFQPPFLANKDGKIKPVEGIILVALKLLKQIICHLIKQNKLYIQDA